MVMEKEQALRHEYRTTWEAFSHKLTQLQAAETAGDHNHSRILLSEVEQARHAHTAARDALMEFVRASETAIPLHMTACASALPPLQRP
jgi:hypothetical protein